MSKRERRWRHRAALMALLLIVGIGTERGLGYAGPASSRSLTGIVQDTDGTPLPAVWITIEGLRTRSGGTHWERTDHAGRFQLVNPPAGEITLRVVPGEASLQSGTLTKTLSDAKDLVIELAPMEMLSARIRDYVSPTGKPRYARLTWITKKKLRATRYTPIAPDGSLRFVHVPKGVSFELWALAAPGRPVRVGELQSGAAVNSATSMKAEQISGRLIHEGATSFNKASVWVEVYPGFRAGTVTLNHDDGTFTISDLPPGEYTVFAAYTSGAVTIPVKQKVRTGTKSVSLDLYK